MTETICNSFLDKCCLYPQEPDLQRVPGLQEVPSLQKVKVTERVGALNCNDQNSLYLQSDLFTTTFVRTANSSSDIKDMGTDLHNASFVRYNRIFKFRLRQ